MSIKDYLIKIKGSGGLRTAGSILVIFLVAIVFFGAGQLYGMQENKADIVLGSFETTSVVENVDAAPQVEVSEEISGEVVASKNGKTYHLPWCAGAKRILPENKVTFVSVSAAEKAGLAPAQNCPGLTTKEKN